MKYVKYIIGLVFIVGFIVASFEPAGPNIHYPDNGRQTMLKSELSKSGIAYETRILTGNQEYIFWSQKDDGRVQEILTVVESAQ